MEEFLQYLAWEVGTTAGAVGVLLLGAVAYLIWDREKDRKQAAKEAAVRSEAQLKQAEAMTGLAAVVSRIEGILIGSLNGRNGP